MEEVELSNESEVLVDRKSKFQARCCSLTDQNSISLLLNSLLDNNKNVAKASHKYIYAWRIGVLKQQSHNNNNTIKNNNKKRNKIKSVNNNNNRLNYTNIQQGYFDCGEAGAGQRLLTLLERANAINVLVIVTRWYGGTPLGPARFRHICSTAAESLKREEVDTYELIETKYSIAFLDTHPKNRLHVLIVPKYHGKFLQDIPDQYLTDILPVAKRFATILTKINKNKLDTVPNQNADEFPFKIIQNNGAQAGQEIDHVHFHFIPVGPVLLGPHADSLDKSVFVQELKEFQHYIKEELGK